MDIGAVPRGAWTERWENVMSNNPTPDIRELRRRYVTDKMEGYRAVFGRRPEPYQLDIWADQFDRGIAAHDAELREQIAQEILDERPPATTELSLREYITGLRSGHVMSAVIARGGYKSNE